MRTPSPENKNPAVQRGFETRPAAVASICCGQTQYCGSRLSALRGGFFQRSTRDLVTGTGGDINPFLSIAIHFGLSGAGMVAGSAVIHSGFRDASAFLKAWFGSDGRTVRGNSSNQ